MQNPSSVPWPLIVAIASAVTAFIFTLIQKRIDFQQQRRSVAVAMFVEIVHAKEGAISFGLNWNEFRENVKDADYHPLLVVSSDIKVLDRIHIENFNYPQEVISVVTSFHNSIHELYECLSTINSEEFCSISVETRVHIIDMVITITSDVEKHANAAISSMQSRLPTEWFDAIV